MPQGDKKLDNKPIVFPSAPDEPRFVYERTIFSSADVTTRKADSELKQLLTGAMEGGEGLGKPYAVAVYRGRIMVTDSVDRFVRVFNVPAGKYYKIGEDEAGSLVKPMGIDVDNAGNVYVADATAKSIMVYDQAGKFLRKIGGPKQFDRLSSVTVDHEGKRIYVVDIGGVSSERHQVRVFDATNGNHLFDIGKRGKGQGEFNLPRDVAIGKDGRIYVVDGGNFRVQVFDASGKYLQAFGSIGKQLGNFARPKEIASDAEGNVYVVDAAFGNFQIFNGDGDLLMYVGERSERDGPARYMLPSGIYVDEDGRIYMVDQWFRKVDIFRPIGLPAEGGYLGRRPTAAQK
ncbi:MAG: 6-bladed beta-propeller [Candidatus Accumulibacter sp.]|uniref:6-bladed beta-propeller n=1 Tax=Accumulibacter sp. TaxID=2053492 RepID=UPI00287845AC|nr:6-bladed beta-propeller [Accumulibacter sp.]MDS4015269.1 6-bladed beta-propeller [Accumulibacter sp.]